MCTEVPILYPDYAYNSDMAEYIHKSSDTNGS